jgi:hypothetical protein
MDGQGWIKTLPWCKKRYQTCKRCWTSSSGRECPFRDIYTVFTAREGSHRWTPVCATAPSESPSHINQALSDYQSRHNYGRNILSSGMLYVWKGGQELCGRPQVAYLSA